MKNNEIETSLDNLLKIMIGDSELKCEFDGTIFAPPYAIADSTFDVYVIRLQDIESKIGLHRNYLIELMEVLNEDKYAIVKFVDTAHKNLARCEITMKGKLFIQQGGYVADSKIKNQNQIRINKIANTTLFLTIVIAFGTMVAAMYYVIEIWKHFHGDGN